MNYYIFKKRSERTFTTCVECKKHYKLVVSRLEKDKMFMLGCPSNILDILSNKFHKILRDIYEIPLAPCLKTFYMDDLIYKLKL